MTDNTPATFHSYGKHFQEKLCFLLVEDRIFADRMSEVLKTEFFEFKYLQVFTSLLFDYKSQYKVHPSKETIEILLRTGLPKENELIQQQVGEFFGRLMSAELDNVEFIKTEALEFCRKQKVHEALYRAAGKLKTNSFDDIKKLVEEALKAGADVDFGHAYLADFEKRYNQTARLPISTGWAEIDLETDGGHGRGEIGIILGSSGGGKSMALVHLGAQAVKNGLNVVHYTLELNDKTTGLRYDACLTGIPMDELISKKEEVVEKIRVSATGTLVIKEYPKKYASVSTIKNHLDRLKVRGIIPDMVIVDYADLLKPTSFRKEKREELGDIYEELEAVAKECSVALWTASQTNRGGVNAELLTMESISEAYNKCFGASLICSISRTIEDRNRNTGKMFIAKNRNGKDNIIYDLFCDMATATIKIIQQHSSNSPSSSTQNFNIGEEEKRRLKAKWDAFKEKNK